MSTTLDILFGLSPITLAPSGTSMSPLRRGIYRTLVRVATVTVPVVTAIVFPDFDRIMAFLGSGMCIAISVLLPICYYFKIFGPEIKLSERILCWTLLLFGTICAIVGTVWAYLLLLSLADM
jgi:solute carrier family 32 (vesicular inhibitory amino acid transporter)